MSTKIRVAYDISLLGNGYVSNQSRTGIFRVVEEVLRELNKRPNIQLHSLSLNKESTIWEEVSSFLYCKNEQSSLLSGFETNHYSRLNILKLYIGLVKCQKALITSSSSRNSLNYKVGRALQICGSQLARMESSVRRDTEDYDLYHGSYFSLPSRELLSNSLRVLTVYDLIPLLFPNFAIPKVRQRAADMISSIDTEKDWIICISKHTKRDFCQYTGMASNRVFVVPLAADSHFYEVKDSFYINKVIDRYGIPKSPYILSLCTLEPRKNIELLIQAFSDLVTTHSTDELNLVLVGISGWKNKQIFEAVQNNPTVRDRIFFTGYLPDQDLAPIYSGALMFVYPSLYEGFGLPPLEAMQCGTPVIVSNTSSLPEVVGDAGILIDPRSKDELCQAMWELVSDERSRKDLSQKAIARASEFTWKKSVDKTVEVYRTAISSKA